MPTKQEVIDSLNKGSYSLSEVRHLITTVKASNIVAPKSVRKGDVFLFGINGKYRPHCVYKVRTGLAYAIPMSTTLDERMLTVCKRSRFFFDTVEDSYFSQGIIVAKLEEVRANFCFVYEHKREIDNAVKELKKLI